jgi:tRNA(fMet)-specific endonuclease VapC
MTIAPVVLDTDTLSLIMRQDPVVLPKARNYLAIHQQFTFTIITRYEVLRGLKAKNAFKQLENFDRLCAVSTILPLTDAAIVEAADIYAHLKNRGDLIMDADILIAASAIVRGMKIVTNNERHFQRIPSIQIENWMR